MKQIALILSCTLIALAPGVATATATESPEEPERIEARCAAPPAPGSGLIRLADSDRDHELTRDEWDALIVQLDSDGDGEITDAELIQTMVRNRPMRPRDRQSEPGPRGRNSEPRPLTDRLDSNQDGFLDSRDLDDIFSDLDEDGDLVVRADEMPPFPFGPSQRGRCDSRGGFGTRLGSLGPDDGLHGGRFARFPGGPNFVPMHRADVDGDGEITLDEWNTFLDSFDSQGVFDALDANGDEIISEDEMPGRRWIPKSPPAK